MLNHISLIGRLVADPEERTLPSGDTHVRFTLAVDRPYAAKNGEREADFIDVVSWGHDKDTIRQYVKKGEPLAVEGRLRIRAYTTNAGETRKVAEVILDRFYFLKNVRRDDEARNEEQHDAPRQERDARRTSRRSSSRRTTRPPVRVSRPPVPPAPEEEDVPF